MFYAVLKVDYQTLTARFYNRAHRDQFVKDHPGAQAVRSKKAKFVPGADTCVTYAERRDDGTWVRV